MWEAEVAIIRSVCFQIYFMVCGVVDADRKAEASASVDAESNAVRTWPRSGRGLHLVGEARSKGRRSSSQAGRYAALAAAAVQHEVDMGREGHQDFLREATNPELEMRNEELEARNMEIAESAGRQDRRLWLLLHRAPHL